MKEQLEQYVKRVKERYELCQGNEATTKGSLIAPLFALLGWDMADPRECQPEFRADFGSGLKAATPCDWAFVIPPAYSFLVEAKACDKKLKPYAEQLAMYFAKASVNLGIYTNGVQWHFYTDLDKQHIMDKEPFLSWDVLDDESLPLDFLTLLQRSQFKPQLVKTFAEQGRRQSLLVKVLTKLLEPSDDFVKLAISVEMPDQGQLETKALHASVVKEWRPILANALQEWVKLKSLAMALEPPVKKPLPSQATETVKKQWKGKTCPSCGVSGLGSKLQRCECGHVFVFKNAADSAVTETQEPATEVETQWHYTLNGKQKVGPVSLTELRQVVSSGQLKPTDMVLQDGQKQWVVANTVPELFSATTIPFVPKDAV